MDYEVMWYQLCYLLIVCVLTQPCRQDSSLAWFILQLWTFCCYGSTVIQWLLHFGVWAFCCARMGRARSAPQSVSCEVMRQKRSNLYYTQLLTWFHQWDFKVHVHTRHFTSHWFIGIITWLQIDQHLFYVVNFRILEILHLMLKYLRVL